MPRRKQGQRVLGPYPYRGKSRIIVFDEGGAKVARLLDTQKEAELVKSAIEDQLRVQVGRTIEEAIQAYEVYMRLRLTCHEQAAQGDDGAVAVLLAMLMGL